MTSEGTVPAPSDEAVEAAARILLPGFGVPESARDAWWAEAAMDAREALTAAYAIDMPHREAEVRAEERAATLREAAKANEAIVQELRMAVTALGWVDRASSSARATTVGVYDRLSKRR